VPDSAIAPLIQYGGAVAVLATVIVLALRGDIRFRPSIDAETNAIRERCETIATELAEWKTVAKDAVAAQRQLAEALEVRNRIDEARGKP
jgi:hypothetical protein